MIDFHCHLDLYPNPTEVIAKAVQKGTYVLAVTTTPMAFEGNLRLIGDAKRIRVAVGLHPELVHERFREVDQVCELMERTRYVGEVGLDGTPAHRKSLPKQREVLQRIFIACKAQGGKVISLHSRMATTLVLDEIERAGMLGIPILHWFSGSADELQRAVSLGCWFSVGPAMLLGQKGRYLTSLMPMAQVLPETDGPFVELAGKILMPWESERVFPTLAAIWGVDVPTTIQRLKDNLGRLSGQTIPL